jgi:hypothetical protein
MCGRAKPRQASEGASDRFTRRVNDSLINFLVVEINHPWNWLIFLRHNLSFSLGDKTIEAHLEQFQ